MKLNFALLCFSLIANCSAFAANQIGFRWGGPIDDGKLLTLSTRISDTEYRLNRADIEDVINFYKIKGWLNRGSGAGIYYSTHLTDSFGDGRRELFIFEISESVPIATGGLGMTVANYYLSGGPKPPMISRYTDTWHVIAVAPSDEEYGAGEKITFHRATRDDADKIFAHLKEQMKADVHLTTSMLSTFLIRVNDDSEYGKNLPLDTRDFIAAFTSRILLEFSSDPVFLSAKATLYENGNEVQRSALDTAKQIVSRLNLLAEGEGNHHP